MKYSENEISARKQVAIAACNFFVSKGFPHVTTSITSTHAEVSLFFDTADELKEAEELTNPFMLDGASRESRKSYTSDGRPFYYIDLNWL